MEKIFVDGLSVEFDRGGMFERTCIVFSHDVGGSRFNQKHNEKYDELIYSISKLNIPYIRFDYSGIGESLPDKNKLDLAVGMVDLQTIVDFTVNKGFEKVLIIGDGFGADVALSLANISEAVSGVCLTDANILGNKDYDNFNKLGKVGLFMNTIEGVEPDVKCNERCVSRFIAFMGVDRDFSHPRDYKQMISYCLDFIFKNK